MNGLVGRLWQDYWCGVKYTGYWWTRRNIRTPSASAWALCGSGITGATTVGMVAHPVAECSTAARLYTRVMSWWLRVLDTSPTMSLVAPLLGSASRVIPLMMKSAAITASAASGEIVPSCAAPYRGSTNSSGSETQGRWSTRARLRRNSWQNRSRSRVFQQEFVHIVRVVPARSGPSSSCPR